EAAAQDSAAGRGASLWCSRKTAAGPVMALGYKCPGKWREGGKGPRTRWAREKQREGRERPSPTRWAPEKQREGRKGPSLQGGLARNSGRAVKALPYAPRYE